MTPGFSLVKEFIDNGYVDAGKALETRKTSDDLEEFVKGESPFMLTGAWAAGRVEGMDPDLILWWRLILCWRTADWW